MKYQRPQMKKIVLKMKQKNNLENEETNNFENSEEIALVDPPPLSPQNRPTGSESSEAVGTGNLAACPLSRIQIYYISLYLLLILCRVTKLFPYLVIEIILMLLNTGK